VDVFVLLGGQLGWPARAAENMRVRAHAYKRWIAVRCSTARVVIAAPQHVAGSD